MSEIGIAETGPESIVSLPPFDLTPPQPRFRVTAAQTWKLYALRLGTETFKGGGKLMFEGSFKDAHDFLDFLERIPMNTPGMEAIKKIQNPQPFIVRVVGPLVTVKLSNEKTCLALSFNE